MKQYNLDNLDTLPPLREVIATHGLNARKSLGQHFLLDLNLTRRIVNVAGDVSGQTVIEIGPGPGGLTRALLESNAAQIIAIEMDTRAITALGDLKGVAGNRLSLIEGDALGVTIADVAPGGAHIVANLPYNISTALLIHWLHQLTHIRSMTLMFQAEVVDRLIAPPGNKQYGRLSVLTQWLCSTKKQFDIKPSAFVPPPKVTSTVVTLTPHATPLYKADITALEAVTKAAFGQRRKMLRSSLKPLGGEILLEKAGIDGTRRAEELSVEEFCKLARATAPDAGP